MSWVHKGYVFTGQFWLDLLAALSLLGDTSFYKEILESDAVVAGKGSRMARMARMASRSSRLTRLIRAARVARIMRLLPNLQKALKLGDSDVAAYLMNKRFWRIFRFID